MRNKPLILIVDDDVCSRDTLETLLYHEEYEMSFAINGTEALEQIEKILPDVVLLDVMMPEIDGFTVCKKVKENKNLQHIPIVLITALNNKKDIVHGLDSGADEFIPKPVNGTELRARVRSMLRIKKQYDELMSILQLREDLARMLVHDLKFPLNVIEGYCQMLLIEKNLSSGNTKYVEKIKEQVRRTNSFINDLLVMAKMESNQLILHRSKVNINDMIKKALEHYKRLAQLKEIDVVVKLLSEPSEILLDVNLFERVFDNLLSNALKFSPEESTVTFQAEMVQTNSEKPFLRIKVSDEGPGIAPEYRNAIFEKFEVIKMQKKGVPQIGLGLAFCKLVVDAHKGRIFVEDNNPGGILVIEIV